MVVGLDVGGTKTNATLLDSKGVFLNNRMVETPSRVLEGPEAAIEAMAKAIELAIGGAGVHWESVRVIGLDTPGPASANGVISSKGGTNFSGKEWWGFDILIRGRRFFQTTGGLQQRRQCRRSLRPSVLLRRRFDAALVGSAIVGTGLGGGVVDNGRVIRGSSGMAGELGHIRISLEDLLQDDQPIPKCNCGLYGDLESIASLTGITKNLLPYWLSKYPNHPLANSESMIAAAKALRGYAEKGDEMALRIFEQQVKAIGCMFSIAANFTDPDADFVGGGIVEAEPHFRDWCMDIVRASTELRDEQRQIVQFAVVPDLDMAGARGSALAALQMLRIAAAYRIILAISSLVRPVNSILPSFWQIHTSQVRVTLSDLFPGSCVPAMLRRMPSDYTLDSIPVTRMVKLKGSEKKEVHCVVGLRDRALIGLMVFTFGCVGAAIGMKV